MSVLGDFISLFYPRYCLACHQSLVKGEDMLCSHCLSMLPKTNYHLLDDNPVKNRLAGRLSLEFGFAFLKFRKGGIVQNILHQLKYHHQPDLGIRIGRMYGLELQQAGFEKYFDLIVPVPLHESRLRKRGYNQSSKFAEGLAQSLAVPWRESISLRKQSTLTQTRKTRVERWHNVKDAFSISQVDQIQGKRILLVDDVITTGATLEACGQHLLDHHCRSLSIACIAEA
jgi:ComF family protein